MNFGEKIFESEHRLAAATAASWSKQVLYELGGDHGGDESRSIARDAI